MADETVDSSQQNPLPAEPQVGELPAVSPPTTSFFVQLFFLPFFIILALVSVWFLFGKLAGERSIEDLVTMVTKGEMKDRWKAAHDLAMLLKENSSYAKDLPLCQAMVASYQHELDKPIPTNEGERVQQQQILEYLTGVVGSFRFDSGVPTLRRVASDNSRPFAIRRAAMISIARLAQNVNAIEDSSLIPDISSLAAKAEESELRSLACIVLGLLNDPKGLPALKGRLGDSSAEVRFNAANSLANLHSFDSLDVLEQMLDLEQLKKEFAGRLTPNDPKEQADSLATVTALSACRSLSKLASHKDGPEKIRSRTQLMSRIEALKSSKAVNLSLAATEVYNQVKQ